ncbi:MAG: DNA gyrase subunit A [Eubacteriales bacterium]|nr:DNA gyrase subunit A [Eubacteriales bacterium]
MLPIRIEDEMKNSYIDYAMSVIVGRALPDIRDGLKPVHRRILYSMYKIGLTPEKSFKKSAHVVGDVLAKYHPHGDSAVYDAMVRMAQDFSTRYPLVSGQGNFGSVDGDSAAAMRYTEVKMAKITNELLDGIEKNTIDYNENYDGSLEEPSVLPSRYPNLLVNGSSGIAVGMATNIPPHNLKEVINGVIAYIENPDIEFAELNKIIKGPDFPTGAIILGKEGIKKAYETGRGVIKIRAKSEIEEMKNGKKRIIVTEIPYMVNKARLIEKIADLVRDKKIDGITDLRDESDRKGMRMVIELRKDVNEQVILNQLYKNTQLQDTFGIIFLAIVNGVPKVLNIKEILKEYVLHQENIIKRRTQYDLDRAEKRAHVVEGLRIAISNIDEVIRTIKKAKNPEEARINLMSKFLLSEIQAQAILDMRLHRLTSLETEKLEEEYKDLIKTIKELKAILGDENKILEIIKKEITDIRDKYSDPRRTMIGMSDENIEMEDLIPEEEVVITISNSGYIKRMNISNYSSQKRGGKGIRGMSTKDEDAVVKIFTSSTHHFILFFTNKGKIYRIKGYEVPEHSRIAKGMHMKNLINLDPGEKVTTVIPIKEFSEDYYMIAATKQGMIKKTDLISYNTQRKDGIAAITLNEGDELVGIELTDGTKNVVMTTKLGFAIRFKESDVRAMGRTAKGVKGINVGKNDEVVSVGIAEDDSSLLVVSNKGNGKRTPLEQYKVQTRGGKGLITFNRNKKKDVEIVGAEILNNDDEVMMISKNGIIIRFAAQDISSMGRATKGVRLMNMSNDDEVVSITVIKNADEEQE